MKKVVEDYGSDHTRFLCKLVVLMHFVIFLTKLLYTYPTTFENQEQSCKNEKMLQILKLTFLF